MIRLLGVLFACLPLAACGYYIPAPTPSIPASTADVRAEIQRLRQTPVDLPRPVVVIDGWIPVGGRHIKGELSRLTGDDDILLIRYSPGTSLEAIAELVVSKVDERWPGEDPVRTVEVDVVGFSAGGVVARLAALAPEPGVDDRKLLDLARLFTISSPHAGTVGLSLSLAPDRAARQMRPGSSTLAFLDGAQPGVDYEMYCYGQYNDQVVSVAQTAPDGQFPIWTYGRFVASHSQSARNRRFLTDIALRLRNEPPISVPGVPLPNAQVGVD